MYDKRMLEQRERNRGGGGHYGGGNLRFCTRVDSVEWRRHASARRVRGVGRFCSPRGSGGSSHDPCGWWRSDEADTGAVCDDSGDAI